MKLPKIDKLTILAIVSAIAIVGLIVLSINLSAYNKSYEEKDKISQFVAQFSEAYNAKVLQENRNVDESTLKKTFTFYTTSSETFNVRAFRERINDSVNASDMYFMIFNIVTGSSPPNI